MTQNETNIQSHLESLNLTDLEQKRLKDQKRMESGQERQASEDVTNPNLHYGPNSPDGDLAGSESIHDLVTVALTDSNGIMGRHIQISGFRSDFLVSDQGDGRFTIEHLKSGEVIKLPKTEYLQFENLTVRREFVERTNPDTSSRDGQQQDSNKFGAEGSDNGQSKTSDDDLHINRDPTLEDQSFTMDEDGSLTITEADLLAGADDLDGDSLSVTDVSGAENGTLIDNGDGTWTFTPDPNWNGKLDLDFTVSDGNGGTVTAQANIIVEAVNDGPTAEDQSFALNEDGSLTITEAQLLVGAEDLDGDALSVTSVSGVEHGILTDNGDGTWTFEPDPDWNGALELDFTVEDGNGGSVIAQASITVEAINDGPTADDLSFTLDEDGSLTITEAQLLDSVQDVDGDDLSVTSVTGVENGTLTDNGNGTWTFEPDPDWNGSLDLDFTVADGNGGSVTAQAEIVVESVNDGPVAEDLSLSYETARTVQIQNAGFEERDLGDQAWTRDALGWQSNANAGDWNPAAGSLAAEASEGENVAWANRGGSLSQILDETFGANTSYTLSVNIGNRQDIGGTGEFEVRLYAGDQLLGATSDASPASGEWDTATLTVNGSAFGEDFGGFGEALRIELVNTGDGNQINFDDVRLTAIEENGLSATEDGRSVSGQLSATDIEGDSLTFSLYDGPEEGIVTVNPDGSYDFDPAGGFQDLGAGETRKVQFTYEVEDGNGGSDQATVTIVVHGTNDGPVASDSSHSAVEDGSAVQGNLSATDGDGDNLVYAVVSGPAEGSVVVNEDGSYRFDPGNDFQDLAVGETRQVTFTYSASDANGGSDEGEITITVTGTNDDPSAGLTRGIHIDNPSFEQRDLGDQAWTRDALGWESNSNAGDWNPATRSLQEEASDGDNVAWANRGGSLSQTIGENFSADSSYTLNVDIGDRQDIGGTGTFEVRLYAGGELLGASSDANPAEGGWDTVELTVRGEDFPEGFDGFDEALRIELVNTGGGNQINFDNVRLTTTADANFTADEDGEVVSGSLPGHDPDGDSLTFSLVSGPDQGTIIIQEDGGYAFDPGSDFQDLGIGDTREVTFTYEVSDGHGGSDQAEMTIIVSGRNDAPVVQDQSFTLNEDGSLTITEAQLLAGASDIDGDGLSVSAVSGIENGTLTDNGDGTWTFEPDSNWSGQTDFTFTVTDGNGGETTATTNVTVSAQADTPSLDVGSETLGPNMAQNGGLEADTGLTGSRWGVFDEVDGWKLSTGSGIEIQRNTVMDASEGNQYIELDSHNNSGIYQDIDTHSGGAYQISFDYSPRPGVSSDSNIVEVLWDGEVIDQVTGNSAGWQTLTYEVSGGEGDLSRIEFRAGGRSDSLGGFIDNISIKEVANTGDENSDIHLTIEAGLTDNDGSETLSLFVDDIPLGAVLSDGNNSFTASEGDVRADISGWDLDGLIVRPPENADSSFTLSVTATATDGSDTASVTKPLEVTVKPVNADPVAQAEDISASEDGPKITGTLDASDLDGDDLTFSLLTSPNEGSFTLNSDGSYEFDPGSDFQDLGIGETRELTFTYEVDDGIGGTHEADITVTVTGANDGPVELTLSGTSVDESSAEGVVVGSLSSSDADGDSLSYRLLDDAGGRFIIDGDEVKVAAGASLNHEATDSHQITVEVSDGNGGTKIKVFSVSISDVVESESLTLVGDEGNDRLTGADNNDTISGNGGNDRLVGGAGADELRGGDGDDTLFIDSDDRVVEGGAGRDTAYVRNSDEGVDLTLTEEVGIERVFSDNSVDQADSIDASAMTQNLDLRGYGGDDTLTG
ncbi:MAG: tandem-95 repeat protein, partial [Pseudomonadota bacterium]